MNHVPQLPGSQEVEVTMTHRRTCRQAQQCGATAQAAASQDAIIRMASEMGIPTEDIAPTNLPILPANAESLDTALGQIPWRPGLC